MSDINITVNDEIVNIDVIDTPVLVQVTNSPGPAGAGVAAGGTTGQVLAKASNTNYDTVWVNASGGTWGTITGTLSNQTDLQNALNAKVPYTGATTNVNLGEYELKAGQLTLDITPTGTAAVGTTRWNDTIGATETTLKGGSVVLKNGVDLVARVVNKVTPNTTLTKAAYQAVRISGAQGQRLAVALAQANNDTNSADTIGLVTETIATNQEGFIMTMGQLEGINTTGSLQGETWVDGDVLYLSPTTAGAITNVQPTGSGHIVVIGYVEYAHANNGKIYVKVLNGWELTELHDTEIVNPLNNEGLFYNSTSTLWENKSISTALGFTPANAATTLTINGVTYDLSTSRTWTISTGISGSGASGQVTYWTGASAVSGSNNLFWDNTNSRLGIGTNAPQSQLHISNSAVLVNTVARLSVHPNHANIITFTNSDGTQQGGFLATGSSFVYGTYVSNQVNLTGNAGGIGLRVQNTTGSHISFYGGNASGDFGTKFFQMTGSTGNFILQNGGTFTDGGQRLQVIGDTLLRGSGATSATTALTVQNSSSTNLFSVRNDGAVSIGSASYNDGLRINRNPILASASSIFVNTAIQTTVNTIYRGIATSVGLFGSGFTLPNLSHFECINDGSFTAGVVTNLYGFRENLGTYVATNVYGFYGAIPAASGRWSLYMNGTADNYLAGDLGIGTTSVTNWLNIAASTTGKAHINLASGVAPTSPANGDIWFDGTDIKMRIGGVTKTFTLI